MCDASSCTKCIDQTDNNNFESCQWHTSGDYCDNWYDDPNASGTTQNKFGCPSVYIPVIIAIVVFVLIICLVSCYYFKKYRPTRLNNNYPAMNNNYNQYNQYGARQPYQQPYQQQPTYSYSVPTSYIKQADGTLIPASGVQPQPQQQQPLDVPLIQESCIAQPQMQNQVPAYNPSAVGSEGINNQQYTNQ